LGEGDKAITASTTVRMRALLRSMPPTMVLPTREAAGSCYPPCRRSRACRERFEKFAHAGMAGILIFFVSRARD
jgi:hypothetical protein